MISFEIGVFVLAVAVVFDKVLSFLSSFFFGVTLLVKYITPKLLICD